MPIFADVSTKAGIENVGGLGQTAAWGDFNGDGCQDLILSNTDLRRSSRNVFLFKNRCNGTFTDVTAGSGIINQPLRSAAWADFDNDGLLDLVVGTIMGGAPPILYKNMGGGVFTDVSNKAGITRTGGVIGHVIWVDYDGDGWIDLFTTNHVHPNRFFRNLGNGKFVDVAPQVRINSPIIDVFAAAWGDFNNDGFMDVFLNGHIGTGLIKGDRTLNGFLVIKLIGNGRDTNTSAIGARVRVSASGRVQIREVSGGRGCCEQDMLPIHFGVGREEKVDIWVKWMGGKECPFRSVDVKGGGIFSISERGCIIQRLGHP